MLYCIVLYGILGEVGCWVVGGWCLSEDLDRWMGGWASRWSSDSKRGGGWMSCLEERKKGGVLVLAC